MNKIAFFYGAETNRLRKIMRKTRDKELCRRANAVLLVLKTKSEVARLLLAGRSLVGRWITWYVRSSCEIFGDPSGIMYRETMRHTVLKYIEVDYNKTRSQSSLGYISPEHFELKNSA